MYSDFFVEIEILFSRTEGHSKQTIFVCSHVFKVLSLVLKYKWAFVFVLTEGAMCASYDTHLCDGIKKHHVSVLPHSDLEMYIFIYHLNGLMGAGRHSNTCMDVDGWSFHGK